MLTTDRPVSWILPQTPSGIVNVDGEGAPTLGFLPVFRTCLLPIYRHSDLYLLRPNLRAAGTVAALAYRIKNIFTRLNEREYRYWRCLGRLRINEWSIGALTAIQQLSPTHSPWTLPVQTAYALREETVSRLRYIRRERRELLAHYEQLEQKEGEYNNYEYKQVFDPGWETHWLNTAQPVQPVTIPRSNGPTDLIVNGVVVGVQLPAHAPRPHPQFVTNECDVSAIPPRSR